MRIWEALALTAVLAGPAAAKTDKGLRYLEKAARRAAAELSGKLSGKVCVLDLTELAAPDATSEFGQKAAELIATRLVERAKTRYRVVERRELIKIARDSVLIAGDDEEVFKRIRAHGGADVLVSGTYSASGAEASLDVKAVDARTLAVLAAATVRVWRTEGLDKMIARRMVAGKDPDAEAQQAPAPRGEVDPLELDAGVFYEGGDGKLYPLRDGMVLNSKDNYALYLKPSKPSYVYVYQVDSSQKAFKIFPNPEYTKLANPMPAAEGWVPEGGEYLYLDENPGREEIYVFASRLPSPSLENLKTARLSDIEATIKTMGVAGRRGAQALSKVNGASGNPLELITRKLSAQGDFFWKTSFIHQ
jgi:Domain of unknown function (DUF4384)/FlgO protein